MSGDVEHDAELFGNEDRYPPHLRRPAPKVLSINQLVSYNMWRARRSRDWSQQEVAELLERYTGRTWSNASVSAAERAWQGGRPRRFDASEIVAMSRIFDMPIIYFFMPDENGNYYAKSVGMREFPDGTPNVDPEDPENDLMGLVPTDEYVHSIGLFRPSPGFVFRMQQLVATFTHLSWSPPNWRLPFEVTRPERYTRETSKREEATRERDAAQSVTINQAVLRKMIAEVKTKFEEYTEQMSQRLVDNLAKELLPGEKRADDSPKADD